MPYPRSTSRALDETCLNLNDSLNGRDRDKVAAAEAKAEDATTSCSRCISRDGLALELETQTTLLCFNLGGSCCVKSEACKDELVAA